jgi:phospholipid/cholesterol/gamma-HCH transport system substrate-binding protein
MKVSNETKVGSLTIITLAILILGFNFLKGKDLFNKSKKVYAVFPSIGSLSKSNDVRINGFNIGKVYDINSTDKDVTGVVATILLSRDVNIPVDSKAIISSPLVGSSFMTIEKGKEKAFLKNGDTLLTRTKENFSIDDMQSQFKKIALKVQGTADTLNIVLNSLNSVINSTAKNNLHEALAKLNTATTSLNDLLDKNGALSKTFINANEITTELKKSTENITKTFANTRIASEKLASLDIKPVLDNLNTTILQLKSIATKLQNNDGTLGSLLNDKKMYGRINDAIESLQTLSDDVRAHPRRYVNLSIFGKKDNGDYLTKPLKKDSTHIQ